MSDQKTGMNDKSLIDVRTSTLSGCCVVRPVGVLDGTTYRWLRNILVKLAVEQPEALIVDLADLRLENQAALTVFSSVWMQVNEWPGVPILLVARDSADQVMVGGAISPFVRSFGTIDEALAAAVRPPTFRLAYLDLEPSSVSPRLARAFVRRLCDQWNVSVHLPAALAVVNELVDNTVVHAGTSCQVRVELRPRTLTIAVRDGSTHEAVLRERLDPTQGGNGLRIVAELAQAWGCSPHLSGGKVVWAALPCARRTTPLTAP